MLYFLTNPLATQGSDLLPGAAHKVGAADYSAPAEQEKMVSLKIPIFSPHFTETPVALVNDEPITMSELTEALGPLEEPDHEQIEVGAADDYQSVLQRLIRSKLIIQEAKNIGLDETSAFQSEIEGFRINTLLQELINNHLKGLEADPADVKDVYQQMSREVQLHTLTFETSADAQQFLDAAKDGDFDQLAELSIEEGKAKGAKDEHYVKIKDLKPQLGQQVYSMAVGGLSTIFRTEDGFLLFQLTDTRFVEDADVEKEAVKLVTDTHRKQKAMEYSNTLTEKYVTFDEALYDQLDFDQNFDQLKNDKRAVATVKGDEPVTITVADLAAKVDVSLFHGADKAQKLQMLNKKKDIAITNMLFKITGVMEAQRLSLDKTAAFTKKMQDFEQSVLFSEFMQKVILPDVKLTPEEIRSYYEEHIDEYSSPAMLRINSLVFHAMQDAESALNKLHKGADFKWVSANSSGLVPPDSEGLLSFDEKLLSLSSLPEDLQENARGAKKGDSLLYAAPEGNYYYVLVLENVYPPEPKPFEKARDAVARTVYDDKAIQLLDEWTTKLKEVYATQIFLTDLEQ